MPRPGPERLPDVTVYDTYNQAWHLGQFDPLYAEAKEAVEATAGQRVVWNMERLTQGRGWGWWSVYHSMDEFEAHLSQTVPNPTGFRLLDITREYTPDELRGALQAFGTYLSSLHPVLGRLKAQLLALQKGYKTGMSIAVRNLEQPNETTLAGREAIVLSDNDLFRDTKRLEIETEALIEDIDGWAKAYQSAWETTSRIITLTLGEVDRSTNRVS